MKPNIALTRFRLSQYQWLCVTPKKSHEHRRADRDGGDNGMRKNVIVTRDRGGGDTNTIVRHEHGFYSATLRLPFLFFRDEILDLLPVRSPIYRSEDLP
jgi:hypothetical protein